MTNSTENSTTPVLVDESTVTKLDTVKSLEIDSIVDDYQALTVQEQERLENIISTINIVDPALSISYGAQTMGEISRFSSSMLDRVKAKDAGMVGEELTNLRVKVKEFDVGSIDKKKSFWASIPLIGRMFSSVDNALAQFETLNTQVEKIAARLDDAMVGLLRDSETLEQLFQHNKKSYYEMNLYIMAGRKKIDLVNEHELPKAQAVAAESSNAMAPQAVRDLVERVHAFERRLHDLTISRTLAVQTAPQIRLLQNNNQLLAEKIQTSLLTMIPIWKNQIVLALAIQNQRNAAGLQKELTDTTNNMLRKNAEMLQQGTLETAREVERSIIDVETIRDVQERLLNTIDETMNIVNEARTRRASVEKELATMEQELHQRLVNASNKPASTV